MLSRTICSLAIVSILVVTPTISAFAPATSSIGVQQHQQKQRQSTFCAPAATWKPSSSIRTVPSTSGSRLAALPLSSISGTARSLLSIPFLARKLIVLFTTVAVAFNFRRLMQPNSLIQGDPKVQDPLPVKAPSCPLIGNHMLGGSRSFGVGYFYYKMSKALGHPRMWVYSFMGQKGVVMSGGQRVKAFLNKEFSPTGIYSQEIPSGILTGDNLLAQGDKKKHSGMRRLVGAAMTPAAVTASMPALQSLAEKQIQRMMREKEAAHVMDTICQDYTLDVAWKQILGLDLKEDEIPTFSKAIDEWILGFASPRVILNIAAKHSKPFKAKKYLRDLILEKIDYLKENGPDDSTLSGMVFARDEEEEDGTSKLTTDEVVENALLLMLAGSETSASTLTNAMLCLGLNSDSWDKLAREQQQIVNKYGDENGKVKFTTQMLDRECPYLDAVVREVMRIKPITSGSPRFIKETMVIDGEQIPKGFGVNWNVMLTHELDPITRKEDGSHMDVRKGFVPERWLDEKTRPTTDFIPMGAGPRYCLGATLAYAEMKVFLATLAQNIARFDLVGENKNIEQGVKWKRMSIMPKALDGVPISIVPAASPVKTETTTTTKTTTL